MIINKMDSYKTDSIVKTIRHSLCSGHEAGPSDEYLRSNTADGHRQTTEHETVSRTEQPSPSSPSLFFLLVRKRREKTDVNGGRGSELRRRDWNPVAVEKDETGQTLSLAWRSGLLPCIRAVHPPRACEGPRRSAERRGGRGEEDRKW